MRRKDQPPGPFQVENVAPGGCTLRSNAGFFMPLVTVLKVTASRAFLMEASLSTLFLAILALLLLLAAVGDLRSREISNWLNGAIALLAIPFWWSVGLSLWPDMALQVGVAFGVFMLFALLFQLGAMGGGDVKMIGALALWLPAGAVLHLLIIMSLAGGALTLVMLVRKKLAKSEAELEVPYGVAIAFAGMWVIAEPFLNHFA